MGRQTYILINFKKRKYAHVYAASRKEAIERFLRTGEDWKPDLILTPSQVGFIKKIASKRR